MFRGTVALDNSVLWRIERCIQGRVGVVPSFEEKERGEGEEETERRIHAEEDQTECSR